MIIYIPDGWYPNGDTRPKRAAHVLEQNEIYVVFQYLDTGEYGRMPKQNLNRTVKP